MAGDWRNRLHEIIFESDTPAGKAFDVALLVCILISVGSVMLDSIPRIHQAYGNLLLVVEWFFTFLFTLEYGLRLASVRQPSRYARSFFGVIDLIAILPSYLSLLFPGTQSLLVVRAFRLLRIFRIFKLASYLGEAQVLARALHSSRHKITVFLTVVGATVTSVGTLMYLIEGEANGFTSIPKGVYWAIVTMTTVGFGDITPKTPLGQVLASVLMIIGYGVIAVPTGIVTTELVAAARKPSGQACPSCGILGHDFDARFCKNCGARI